MNDVATTTGSPASAPAPRLGERTRRRPPPGFGHVLGAAAGAFAVVAIVAFVVEVSGSDPTAPGVGFDAALAIAALVVGFRAPGPLRSAGVTILVLTVPIIWFFALFGSGGGGRSELRAVYLLSIATYLVLYLVGWTRGRAILLAGALLFLAGWIGFEVAGDSATVVPFQDQVSTPFSISGSSSTDSGTSGTLDHSGTLNLGNSNQSDDTSTTALVIGLVFLGTGALLDRRTLGRRGDAVHRRRRDRGALGRRRARRKQGGVGRRTDRGGGGNRRRRRRGHGTGATRLHVDRCSRHLRRARRRPRRHRARLRGRGRRHRARIRDRARRDRRLRSRRASGSRTTAGCTKHRPRPIPERRRHPRWSGPTRATRTSRRSRHPCDAG